ncbi:hypothetical protein J0X19_08360 [Hymenobacter sp. BT186]|uniref:Uncharacterized protein n=1 Tax=Hymenobacter telluris TaxID=2816474 RepID=A0A939J8P0_9BACT|nr:hypothetical protein [Hymenobacter telluris]MBO0357954.1 hypothetical protein [Hymenobacter telluris]MBW3373981.1 hypothetical protein [Hymenobacter norwichensis]
MPVKFLFAAILSYLLFGFAFWQGTKTRHLLPTPALYSLTPVDSSRNQLLKTAYFTGVLLDSRLDSSPPAGLKPIQLTPAQVLAAEVILQACVASGNTRGTEPRIEPGMLHHLAAYYRQYQGYRTATGQTIVWLNGFARSSVAANDSQWQRHLVRVEDGGKNYFNIFIDISHKECFHFFRNSIGG